MQYLENKKSNKKNINFQADHSSGIINRRLDCIFISNKIQDFSNDTDIIPAYKTDHSFVLVTISNYIFLNQAQALENLITH